MMLRCTFKTGKEEKLGRPIALSLVFSSILTDVAEQKTTTDHSGLEIGEAYKGSAEIAELLSQKVVRSANELTFNSN